MNDKIHDMKTYFYSADFEITPEKFADIVLSRRRRTLDQQEAEMGFVPSDGLWIRNVQLRDPKDLVEKRPVIAYVNAGEWKAKCDTDLENGEHCNGAEYVHFEHPIFMCGSCWNITDGHRWRPVVLPDLELRGQIEKALLVRKKYRQHWLPEHNETVAMLEFENIGHGLPARLEEEVVDEP